MDNLCENIIRDMRVRCRRAMDGVVSSGMREYGLEYKLNFGVPVQQIRKIASRYMPSKKLAEKLWQDGTRELKIMATLLYPREEFTEDTARRWLREIPNQEIREQLGFNLFQYLPFACRVGMECANDEDIDVRTTGYWFLARYIVECGYNDEADYGKMDYIWDDLALNNLFLRNGIKLLLKNIGLESIERANEILRDLKSFKESEDPAEREIFHGLMFDFQYYHGNAVKQIEFL